MLTEKQLTELEPLTKHDKFGILLKDAIETWKIATPVQQMNGLNGYFDFLDANNPECCLLGAAFCKHEKIFEFANSNPHCLWKLSFNEAIKLVYNLPSECANDIIDGFDGLEVHRLSEEIDGQPDLPLDTRTEGYIFAAKVRKILFGK